MTFEITLDTAKSLVGNVADKKVTNDFVGERGQNLHPKVQIVQNCYEHAVRLFVKRPDHVHSFGERFQMLKMNFDTIAVDGYFGCPFDRNPGTPRRHHDDVPIRTSLEIANVAVVRQNFRPKL